jgi:hypothetical protein
MFADNDSRAAANLAGVGLNLFVEALLHRRSG